MKLIKLPRPENVDCQCLERVGSCSIIKLTSNIRNLSNKAAQYCLGRYSISPIGTIRRVLENEINKTS